MNEARGPQANESPSNAEAINQTNTAPPGTGPPPMLNEVPEISQSQPASDVAQTNGKILAHIYCVYIITYSF